MEFKKEELLQNRYKIIDHIGTGGMSYVYKAFDTKMKREVAIKILKSDYIDDYELVDKFKKEAQNSAKLSHINIVSAFDVIDENDLHCIVMEYVDGVTLKKYIQSKGHLSNEETVDIAIQIAKGLEAAHSQGIIHRDIKPQNVILTKKHIAKVSDFGIARAVGSSTISTSVVGSVHYVSPEQSRGSKVDERSDIYSLGCTMYEMITGKTPFEGDNTLSIIFSHLKDTIKKPSLENKDIYQSLEKIILKSTSKEVNLRYQNANDLIKDLKKAIKRKNGDFVSGLILDEEEGTVRISDTDMATIKSWQNDDETKIKGETLSESKAKILINKYSKKIKHKHNKKIAIITSILFIILFMVLLINITNNRKKYEDNIIASASNIINTDIKSSEEEILNETTIKIPIEEDSLNETNYMPSILKMEFMGVKLETAKEIVEPYGIKIWIQAQQFNENYDAGKIIWVNGNEFKRGDRVDVIISKGPKVLNFTNKEWLHSLSLNEMIQMFDQRGLLYSIVESYDDNVPLGHIISANKELSTDRGKLEITVSLGSEGDLQEVPYLLGQTLEKAKALILSNNFTIGNVYKQTSSEKVGNVINQSKAYGEKIKRGSSIDLIVSQGLKEEDKKEADKIEESIENNWHSSISTSYTIGSVVDPSNNPIKEVIVGIRLRQDINGTNKYTDLALPKIYKSGTEISINYSNIKGVVGVTTGVVEVVDLVNNQVMQSYTINFSK
ncbi:MAG: Stk1 family PASTA domain-containing Ser/Thr kinase [Eubacteriales bacterium]|nr:Stk1 family PASTA domain-containing Ser/Thr kinase [Eubacteriales bacterium]